MAYKTQDRIALALELLQEPPKTRKGKKYILLAVCLLILCTAVGILFHIAFPVYKNSYEDDYIKLKYAPEGFVLTELDTNSLPHLYYAMFQKEDDEFRVSFTTLDGNHGYDTENSTVEDITVNGYEGIYIDNPRFHMVVWYTQENLLDVGGSLPKDELLKIAKNLEKK